VYLAERLGLEFDYTNIEKILYGQGAELTYVQLVELEAANFKDKKDAESGPVEEPPCLITKKMATTFYEVSSAMARFLKVQKAIVVETFTEKENGYCLVISRQFHKEACTEHIP
jgi:hypothetical protein